MGLGKYFKKRNFHKTPEPKGGKGKTGKLAFVVQEHHASHLHFDFRLELDGVLKSWAVPKGPSLDPHEHHLAIHVEDHPFDYRKFEGTIPEGNYGAGTVKIWDEGWYEARKGDPTDQEKTLRKELKKGHITFIVHGKKLKGEFALIQMYGKDEKAWLLVKKGDEFARPHGKPQPEVAKPDQPIDLSKYPKKTSPWNVKPMLCTLVEQPFSREDWLFEIKWDGYRAIGSKNDGKVELYSRNDTNFIDHYPPVAEAMRAFKHDVIVDGEIVVVDKDGVPHFEALQDWRRTQEEILHYYIFDLLWFDGHDIRDMPLRDRKRLLKDHLPKNDVLRFSDHVQTDGEKLFEEMQKNHMEGMVAKRADSPYRQDVRGQDWLKIKTGLRQEVVIGGYTEPRNSRKYLGSLVVGVYKDSKLHYVGHSGGGIPESQLKVLRDKLAKIECRTSPFVVEPKPNAPVHWVEPTLVCEMSFSEWTKEGYMRHPKFEGMREDKKPTSVHHEKAASPSPAAHDKSAHEPFEFTHLDKVFFPKHSYTKGDLIDYYKAVADYILPYLKDRACSMNRMPHGITGDSFFQKNNDHLPDWVPHADIFSESNNADLHWIVGGDLPTLLYMVQLGCVEINPWNSRVKHLDNPDWIVIDLDPEGVSFKKVIEVAHTVKEVCDEWKIPGYPKTSGKTGLHIYIPLQAKYTYEQAKNLAHLIVLEVNKRQPKVTSVERMPAKRKNRIYLDFLQNRAGQTLAAPYSVRPTPDASVSMPLRWDEVTPDLKPSDFTIKNVPARLKKVGDIWKPVLGKGIDLAETLRRISKSSEPV